MHFDRLLVAVPAQTPGTCRETFYTSFISRLLMKISHVESFLFNPGSTRNLLFCRIETDDGLHGWGEAYVTMETEKAVDEYLRGIMPHLIGRSPFSIRHTGQVLFDDFVIRRSSVGF